MTDPLDATPPPIPGRLRMRPTVGGLVHPYVNAALADGGVDFRVRHNARVVECLTRSLCQVCAQALGHPAVFLGGPADVAKLLFTEPGVHPECADYTSRACPMVAGRRTHFASTPPVSQGKRGRKCATPGCRCAGWVEHDPDDYPRLGQPAHPWYAVWARDYAIASTPAGDIFGAAVDPADVLRVRLISTPGEGRTPRTLSPAEVAEIVSDPATGA